MPLPIMQKTRKIRKITHRPCDSERINLKILNKDKYIKYFLMIKFCLNIILTDLSP